MALLQKFQTALLGMAAGCFLLGAMVTVADVIVRGVAHDNITGAIEITSFLIGLGALLSMPVCYVEHAHVCAKLLSEMNPNLFARSLGVLGSVCSVIFAALMLWVLGSYTIGRIDSPETSRDLGLNMTALMWVVTATMALALLAAIAGILTRGRPPRVSEIGGE